LYLVWTLSLGLAEEIGGRQYQCEGNKQPVHHALAPMAMTLEL
jgi:hypothetical protein